VGERRYPHLRARPHVCRLPLSDPTFAVLLQLPSYSLDVTHLNAHIGFENYLGFATIWQIRNEQPPCVCFHLESLVKKFLQEGILLFTAFYSMIFLRGLCCSSLSHRREWRSTNSAWVIGNGPLLLAVVLSRPVTAFLFRNLQIEMRVITWVIACTAKDAMTGLAEGSREYSWVNSDPL
jgi:hypothetical protein